MIFIVLCSLRLFFQETDEFFERQKQFLLTYNTKIKDATAASDKSTRAQKSKSLFLEYCLSINPL
jgi:hypothetical protein